jgi:hypothetical protein
MALITYGTKIMLSFCAIANDKLSCVPSSNKRLEL